MVAEGPHLLEEALTGSWTLESVVATENAGERYASLLQQAEVETVWVSPKTFGRISAAESAQGVLCLLRPRPYTWGQLTGPRALIVVMDTIQDPGNAGTIVRSAEAFGASGVVLTEGSVRISNPKFLRAAAGSLFRLPCIEQVTTAQVAEQLSMAGIPLLALEAGARVSLQSAALRSAVALVVGNEGAGVSDVLKAAGTAVSIPVSGLVESLNAGVACSLALYEAHNQRMSEGKRME